MLQLEVFVFKFLAVDRLSASAVASGEVSSLNHETLDDTVEARACNIPQTNKDCMPVEFVNKMDEPL